MYHCRAPSIGGKMLPSTMTKRGKFVRKYSDVVFAPTASRSAQAYSPGYSHISQKRNTWQIPRGRKQTFEKNTKLQYRRWDSVPLKSVGQRSGSVGLSTGFKQNPVPWPVDRTDAHSLRGYAGQKPTALGIMTKIRSTYIQINTVTPMCPGPSGWSVLRIHVVVNCARRMSFCYRLQCGPSLLEQRSRSYYDRM